MNRVKLSDEQIEFLSGAEGWSCLENGSWTYVENGTAATGWKSDIPGWEGQWFYFDNSGAMKVGWSNVSPSDTSSSNADANNTWLYIDQ